MANTHTLVVSSSTRIGWVGTGVMGLSMCGHLVDRGHAVTVNSRTRSRAQRLLDRGATWAGSARAVAEASDVTFAIVGFPADVREVFLGSDGLLAGASRGSVLVDMTTTEPRLAVEIYEAGRAQGVSTVDAPVSGGDVGARNATLSIMIGGERETVDTIRPLLEAMGKNLQYLGAAGSGQHTKMCNQIVIAGTMIGVCESLLYGYRAGLDLEVVLAAIGGGAAGCWTLTNLAPRVLERNFDPGFFVDHFIKDMGIALDEARRMGLALPGLALVHQLYQATRAQGHGQKGTHALMLALERISNVEPA